MRDIVLSGGVEITSSRPMEGKPAHMREPVSMGEVWYRANYGADQAYWYQMGMGEGVGVKVVQYASDYGLTIKDMDETLAHAAINNRRAAVRNPRALFATKEFADEAKENGFNDTMEYMKSKYNPLVGTALRPNYAGYTADGASALIVCPTEMAKKFTDKYVEVIGIGLSTASGYHDNRIIAKEAFAQAYEMAKIDPSKDVDYMHVHDCPIQTHIIDTEIGGYFKPGESWHAIQEGRTAFDGDRPLGTSGGRTSMGHAFSASAGAEIAEAVWQMRGANGDRQIKPAPEVSVVENVGHGMTTCVTVLRSHN
jgi:acetyl-CoA C-acetyltransferase